MRFGTEGLALSELRDASLSCLSTVLVLHSGHRCVLSLYMVRPLHSHHTILQTHLVTLHLDVPCTEPVIHTSLPTYQPPRVTPEERHPPMHVVYIQSCTTRSQCHMGVSQVPQGPWKECIPIHVWSPTCTCRLVLLSLKPTPLSSGVLINV